MYFLNYCNQDISNRYSVYHLGKLLSYLHYHIELFYNLPLLLRIAPLFRLSELLGKGQRSLRHDFGLVQYYQFRYHDGQGALLLFQPLGKRRDYTVRLGHNIRHGFGKIAVGIIYKIFENLIAFMLLDGVILLIYPSVQGVLQLQII